MRAFFIAILCALSFSSQAQDEINLDIKISADTIYFGNAFKIEMVMHNGRFDRSFAPSLDVFDLLQGPSRSTSMSIINGVRSSFESYTYYFRPQKTGRFRIPKFTNEYNGAQYHSKPFDIIVIENPDNLQQDPNTGQVEGRKRKKSTRKRYKI